MKIIIDAYSILENKDVKLIISTNDFKLEKIKGISVLSTVEKIREEEKYILNYLNKNYLIDKITYLYLEKRA